MLRRARAAAEVARRIGASPEPLDGSPEPILCDLYRQSIYWSLQALNSNANANPNPNPNRETEAPARLSPTASSWRGIDSSLLLKAAGSEDLLVQVDQALGATFMDFAALTTEKRAALLSALRSVAVALIAELEIPDRIVTALWLQRILRVGLLLVLIVLAVVVVAKLRDGAEARRDIAGGKPWRTSSFYGGCHSPQQGCSETPEYFFHTQQEANPWVEFDLGATSRFSAVRVDNRKDCCTERASPLLVEASSDQEHWKALARHEGVFSSWRADFAPTNARWVRVRVESKQGLLHLARVRILR